MNRPATPDLRDGPTAFVLNVSFAGLSAIRSLGRAGVNVIGIDPNPRHLGFASRYATSLVTPHPVLDPDGLVNALVEQASQLDQPGILSPASDGYVLFMSRNRERLAPWFRFTLPPPEVSEATVDKRKLYELADRVGYHHADTLYPETMEDIERIKGHLHYPVFIKPYLSHTWQIAFPDVGKGIKVFGPEELVAAFARILPTGERVMVQSIIKGPPSNVCTVYVHLDPHGNPLGLVTTRKVRQFPMEFGLGSLAETVHEPDLAEYGLEFFRRIGFRGFGTVEFKRDDTDGRLKITDLNPRWVRPTNLPVRAGVNFPVIHYRELIGDSPEPQLAFEAGIRWIDIVGDLHSSIGLMRSRELTPWAWARSLAGVRSFAAFDPGDMKPFLREHGYGRRVLRAPIMLLRRRP